MIAWRWRCVVLAPCGEPIPGTEATTKLAAIRELMPDWLWPFALSDGYRTKWVKEETDEDEPSGVLAGTITIGRGSRW